MQTQNGIWFHSLILKTKSWNRHLNHVDSKRTVSQINSIIKWLNEHFIDFLSLEVNFTCWGEMLHFTVKYENMTSKKRKEWKKKMIACLLSLMSLKLSFIDPMFYEVFFLNYCNKKFFFLRWFSCCSLESVLKRTMLWL